jgi:hypothetical protein
LLFLFVCLYFSRVHFIVYIISIMPKKEKGKKKAEKKKRKVKSIIKHLARPKVKGHGSYLGDLGSHFGSMLGDAATSAIGRIIGSGDYKVKTNTLMGGSPPQFDGHVVVAHREYICDIATPGDAFTIAQSFSINPLNSNLFPWLSGIAAQFEQYKIRGMLFEFKSNSGDAIASTDTALGTVIMATQYNVEDNAFTSKLSMEQYEYCTSAKPSESVIHMLECAPKTTILEDLYVSDSSNPQYDPRFSDFGIFTIATQGQQAACTIGELWITYQIEFIKPKMLYALSNRKFFMGFCNTIADSAHIFNDMAIADGSNLPVTVSDDTITLGAGNAGNYIFWVLYTNTSNTWANNITKPIFTGGFTEASVLNNTTGNPQSDFFGGPGTGGANSDGTWSQQMSSSVPSGTAVNNSFAMVLTSDGTASTIAYSAWFVAPPSCITFGLTPLNVNLAAALGPPIDMIRNQRIVNRMLSDQLKSLTLSCRSLLQRRVLIEEEKESCVVVSLPNTPGLAQPHQQLILPQPPSSTPSTPGYVNMPKGYFR